MDNSDNGTMAFKDFVADDIDNVFFNLDEFAEERMIRKHGEEPQQMRVVFDDNALLSKNNGNIKGAATYGEQVVMYVREREYGGIPKKGAVIFVDDESWRIQDAVRENGSYRITMERVVSNAQSRRTF